jgi:hypothetical protein
LVAVVGTRVVVAAAAAAVVVVDNFDALLVVVDL